MKQKQNLEKTSFYLDRAVLDAAIKKMGEGANISAIVRQCLSDIVDNEVVRLKVSEETKRRLDLLSQYPNSNNIIEEIFAETLDRAKERIQKEIGKLW